MRHTLKAQQFTPELISVLFSRQLGTNYQDKRRHQKIGNLLQGKMMFLLFFEPSTRTRISFAAAGQRLGMQVVATENAQISSSLVKGESLEDTIQVLCEYQPDVIVMRHFEINAAKRAAAVSNVPIINAGDGAGQHPSQALLIFFCTVYYREAGRMSDLTIALVPIYYIVRPPIADLPPSQVEQETASILVSPKELQLANDVKLYLNRHGTTFEETDNLEYALKKADVIYLESYPKRTLYWRNTATNLCDRPPAPAAY